jgi:hypothetical protein
MVITDAFISLDDVEFSGQNTKVALHMSAAASEVTPMGSDTKVQIGGLKDWSASFEFNGDESITGVFFDKVGEVIPVKIRAAGSAVSVSNPSYEGDALVTEYVPLDSAVGDAHKVSLTVVASGPLSRVTTVTP